MSTAVSVSSVKQALLLELEQVGEQLKELVLALPDELEELEQAEERVRAGVLELGRGLLQAWSKAAPLRVAQPECEHCEDARRERVNSLPPAAALFGEGTAEAKEWSAARQTELWEGRWRDTLAALDELKKQLRSPGKREELRKLRQYLLNNQQRIDYPRYRALGLRIGSGQVEGACKSLVGGRCKQAGMRNWTRAGAEGVLRLRAALQSGDYDTLWTHHLKTAA